MLFQRNINSKKHFVSQPQKLALALSTAENLN